MESQKTFTATIHVGTKPHGEDVLSPNIVYAICQEYVDKVGLCVTITPTKYVYSNGSEDGFAIGLIQYPRFPAPEFQIRNHAMTLAELLRIAYRQFRVSVVFPDETVMISEPKAGEIANA